MLPILTAILIAGLTVIGLTTNKMDVISKDDVRGKIIYVQDGDIKSDWHMFQKSY